MNADGRARTGCDALVHTGNIWCIYMEIAEPARRQIVKNSESNHHAEQTKDFLAQLYGLPDKPVYDTA